MTTVNTYRKEQERETNACSSVFFLIVYTSLSLSLSLLPNLLMVRLITMQRTRETMDDAIILIVKEELCSSAEGES